MKLVQIAVLCSTLAAAASAPGQAATAPKAAVPAAAPATAAALPPLHNAPPAATPAAPAEDNEALPPPSSAAQKLYSSAKADLLQTRGNEEVAGSRQPADEELEYCRLLHAQRVVGIEHGQLIKIGQQRWRACVDVWCAHVRLLQRATTGSRSIAARL